MAESEEDLEYWCIHCLKKTKVVLEESTLSTDNKGTTESVSVLFRRKTCSECGGPFRPSASTHNF